MRERQEPALPSAPPPRRQERLVRSEATTKDTEALANLRQLLRGWEQAKLKGFPGLEADVAAARETVRELEERLAAEESCDE